jgi:hypothetical protein
VKLTEVISNVVGTSGRAILGALIAGETDPAALVDRTEGRLKAPREKLIDALRGRVKLSTIGSCSRCPWTKLWNISSARCASWRCADSCRVAPPQNF